MAPCDFGAEVGKAVTGESLAFTQIIGAPALNQAILATSHGRCVLPAHLMAGAATETGLAPKSGKQITDVAWLLEAGAVNFRQLTGCLAYIWEKGGFDRDSVASYTMKIQSLLAKYTFACGGF